MHSGDGEDSLYGNNGDDTLCGGVGNDCLSGGAGNDLLDGCEGNDTLIGGLGDDCLIGGAGSDRFLLSTNSGIDIIADFEAGKDLLMLGNGLTFEQLSVVENNGSALIQLVETGATLAVLNGISVNTIGVGNFSLFATSS